MGECSWVAVWGWLCGCKFVCGCMQVGVGVGVFQSLQIRASVSRGSNQKQVISGVVWPQIPCLVRLHIYSPPVL